MTPEPYDVVIVGGGLAGSAAAILLARAGLEVALLERGAYPRHKVCGEFLSPETRGILKTLGVWEAIGAESPAVLTTARITEPGGRTLDIPLPAAATGFSRFRLDDLLFRKAARDGATVLQRCAVSQIEGSLNGGFTVRAYSGAFRARLVLGAWGKRSTLDRTLDRTFFARNGGFVALKAHVRGPDTGDRTELHAFRGGYCGLNSVEGGNINVCLLASDAAWQRAGRSPEGIWEAMQVQNEALARHLRDAEKCSHDVVISNISFSRKRVVVNDILMLGDSAALISPLAGDGQAMALQSALLAAPLAASFLDGRIYAADLQQSYRRAWSRQFRERLRLGRLLQPLFLDPRALRQALRAGQLVPSLASWLVQGTRQRDPSN